MRVENPTKFGEVMLHLAMNGPTPDAQQLSALFGREERTFKLTDRPMVHLTYQTAFVDDAGKLQLREDIYGFDERIRTILHSDERRIADLAPPEDAKREQANAPRPTRISCAGSSAREAPNAVRVLRPSAERAAAHASKDTPWPMPGHSPWPPPPGSGAIPHSRPCPAIFSHFRPVGTGDQGGGWTLKMQVNPSR